VAIIFGRNSDGSRNPLTAQEQAMARVLYTAIREATDSISVEQLAKIIERLDPPTLERLLKSITIQKNSKNIQNALLNSIDIGGNEAIRSIANIVGQLALPAFLPKPVKILNPKPMANMEFTKLPAWALPNPPVAEFTLSFNKTNPNSLAFASRRAGELVTSIDDLTRLAIRDIITESFAQQLDVRATAKRIKNIIGLHPRWAKAVTKYEQNEINRLIKAGVSEITARERASKSATSYSERLKTARAKMIARTEIQIAQNEGRLEGWQQASEAGYVDPSSMKMWIIAQDERTCPICIELDGEIVPWNGIFSSGHETPGRVHPNCRCTMVIIPPERGTK